LPDAEGEGLFLSGPILENPRETKPKDVQRNYYGPMGGECRTLKKKKGQRARNQDQEILRDGKLNYNRVGDGLIGESRPRRAVGL